MLDDPAHLAANRVALADAQICHLLDQVREIEREIRPGRGDAAQRLRLIAGPGVEVLLVELLQTRGHET